MRLLYWQIDTIGRFFTNSIIYTWNVLVMVYLSLRATIYDQAQGFRTIISVLSAQVYFTGWQALPLITILSLATGSVVILQSASNVIGGAQMIGNLMIIIIMREIAPLLTALVVVARSGTAVASEIGNMRANREIEALESMGINPLSYIVFPRIVGGVISIICLCSYFVFIALMGGFLVTRLVHDLPFSFYSESIARAVTVADLWLFILKNAFSGMIIFVVCCYQGLLVRKSPTEVPVVTTQAVVKSIIYVIMFNLFVTALFYANQFAKLGVL